MWCYDGAVKLLVSSPRKEYKDMSAKFPRREALPPHLCVHNTVLGARHEHEALDFHEIGQLGGIELSHADSVRLLSARSDHTPELGNDGQVLGCEEVK